MITNIEKAILVIIIGIMGIIIYFSGEVNDIIGCADYGQIYSVKTSYLKSKDQCVYWEDDKIVFVKEELWK